MPLTLEPTLVPSQARVRAAVGVEPLQALQVYLSLSVAIRRREKPHPGEAGTASHDPSICYGECRPAELRHGPGAGRRRSPYSKGLAGAGALVEWAGDVLFPFIRGEAASDNGTSSCERVAVEKGIEFGQVPQDHGL